VSVYGPFKRYYNSACDDWMLTNVRPMTIFDIAEIATNAFARAFTPTNITAGFSKAGIEPFSTDKFDDDEFLQSSVTDRPYPASPVEGKLH
jgi:hypothetical protein